MLEKLLTVKNRTRVIGNFQPSKFDKETIQNELDALLIKKFGKKTLKNAFRFDEVAIRDPAYNRDLAESRFGIDQVGKFHHDKSGARIILVVWSNCLPTIVKLASGKTLAIKNGDIVLIVNHENKHRMPLRDIRKSESERWFYRRYIPMPEKI